MNDSETHVEPSTFGTTRKHSAYEEIIVRCVLFGFAVSLVFMFNFVRQLVISDWNAKNLGEIMMTFHKTGQYDPHQKDSYGNPITFKESHKDGYKWLLIRSHGPDGELGTDDDCVRVSGFWDGDGDEPENMSKKLKSAIFYQWMQG